MKKKITVASDLKPAEARLIERLGAQFHAAVIGPAGERLVRYAKLVGRENVLAGTDCGMGTRVANAEICWAKLEAMVEGAAIASKKLWSSDAGSG